MSTERALALVVRGTDWSETSRIATLWTREFGKVRALAKGGRRLRSSFEVAFDLLTVCHIVFIKKHSGGLDLLTEAQVAERFPHLRTDLSALYVGYYVAELLSDGTQDYDPHPALFDAALETLRALGDNPSTFLHPPPASGRGLGGGVEANLVAQGLNPSPSPSPKRGGEKDSTPTPAPPLRFGEGGGGRGCDGSGESLLQGNPSPGPSPKRGGEQVMTHAGRVSAFELVWLRELGYSPRLDACAGCGRSVPDPPPVRLGYSPVAGGVLCTACRATARDHRSLSATAWAALRAMASGDPHLPSEVRQEVRQALGQTISYVLGRRPRLLGYVDGA